MLEPTIESVPDTRGVAAGSDGIASRKTSAGAFLVQLKTRIEAATGRVPSMNERIAETMAAALHDEKMKHLRKPEAAFLNTFVVPALFGHLRDHCGLTDLEARRALLNEYHRSMPETSDASPIRALKHPFRKAIGLDAQAIYRRWMNPAEGLGLTQSAPDFAVREPCPCSVVFEGKYFPEGGHEHAATELVKALYEAFFYRGLPALPATGRRPAWGYDYACLVAFDASAEGSLRRAWEALDEKVRASFWDGANVYVMILGDRRE